MGFASWRELYESDWQSVYALWVAPILFLLFLLLRRESTGGRRPSIAAERAAFVRVWAVVFACETILDPFATGPLLRWLGFADGTLATVVLVLFVLLGDFRVFCLIFSLLSRQARLGPALREAAAWTLVVPLASLAIRAALASAVGELPSQSIWLIYECGFTVLALALRSLAAGRRAQVRPYAQAILAYVATYYALWATADALILFAHLDVAWLLRILPNQLYYSFFVPFAYLTFFSRWYVATSSSTQASR
jgi:hypothetical protein